MRRGGDGLEQGDEEAGLACGQKEEAETSCSIPNLQYRTGSNFNSSQASRVMHSFRQLDPDWPLAAVALEYGGQLIRSADLFVIIYQSGIWLSIPENKWIKVIRQNRY